MAEKSYKRELEHFFEVLKNQYRLVEAVEEEFNLQFGASFNLIEIFQPDEIKLSAIIAELLNPRGTHGQKSIFLRCFVEKLKEVFEKENIKKPLLWLETSLAFCETAQVLTEVNIRKGRIDILVKFGKESSFLGVIAIENKPWAGEQEDQLKRYAEYLRNSSDYPNYLLIFLTEEGRDVYSLEKEEKERLKAEGKFFELSYNHFLKEWIKECIKECKADKVRFFLKDFLFWIKKNFPVEVFELKGN